MKKIHRLQTAHTYCIVAGWVSLITAGYWYFQGKALILGLPLTGFAIILLIVALILFAKYQSTDSIYERICVAIRVGHTGRKQIFGDSRMANRSHDAIDCALLQMVEEGWLTRRLGSDYEVYFSFTEKYKKHFPYERVPSIDET